MRTTELNCKLYKVNYVKNMKQNKKARTNVRLKLNVDQIYAAHFDSKPIQNDDRIHYSICKCTTISNVRKLMPMRAHWNCAIVIQQCDNVRISLIFVALYFSLSSIFIRSHVDEISGEQTCINRIECFGMHFLRLQQVRGPHRICICKVHIHTVNYLEAVLLAIQRYKVFKSSV